MQAKVSVRPPTTLSDAKRGDLFVVHASDLEGAVCCLAHEVRLTTIPDPVPRREVVLLCDSAKSSFLPGTMIVIDATARITFLTQTEPAQFRERDLPMTPAVRAHLEKRLGELRSEFSAM